MGKIKTVLFFFFLTLHLNSFGYMPEEGNVTATVGPFIYKTNFEKSDSGATSPYLGGFGIVATGDVNNKGSLEIAIFDQHKIYIRHFEGKYISEQKEVIHITMGYRWWHNPYLSTSLSFYSSYSLGDPVTIHTDFAPGTGTDTSAQDTTEYGFDFAAQTDLWNYERWALIAEARYSLSVTHKPGEKSDHYGILLGVRYIVQEKFSNP